MNKIKEATKIFKDLPAIEANLIPLELKGRIDKMIINKLKLKIGDVFSFPNRGGNKYKIIKLSCEDGVYFGESRCMLSGDPFRCLFFKDGSVQIEQVGYRKSAPLIVLEGIND